LQRKFRADSMLTWVLLSLTAGTLQAFRNALSRSLVAHLPSLVNSWARFAFLLPWIVLVLCGTVACHGWPQLSLAFFTGCAITAWTQLLANVFLVMAFRRSTFGESIVLHKLEVAFAAILGVAFFAEEPSMLGWLGVACCTGGVLWINLRRGEGEARWRRAFQLDGGAWLALACGFLLVAASFALKRANDELVSLHSERGMTRPEAAVHVLFHTVWMEILILTAAVQWKHPGWLALVSRHHRRMMVLGLVSFGGSFCWFWAYAIALVAYVKAVGQIEAVVAVAISLWVFQESSVRRQLPGMALVVGGILLILVGSLAGVG
jgi:drug/metabolite transporter (DMT)-like permease